MAVLLRFTLPVTRMVEWLAKRRRPRPGPIVAPPRTRPAVVLPPAVRRSLVLAWAALFWERFWPSLWPALGVVLAFLILAVFDLLPWTAGAIDRLLDGGHLGAGSAIGGLFHATVLIVILSAFGLSCYLGFRGFRWPTRHEARRRLERDSEFSHQPISTLTDRNVLGRDAVSDLLWQEHRRRQKSKVVRLRVTLPRDHMIRRDPWGVRMMLSILLIIGLVEARWDLEQRLWRALIPPVSYGGGTMPPDIRVWIMPPAYTGRPPVRLDRDGTRRDNADPEMASRPSLAIPIHSKILAQLNGGHDRPVLDLGDRVVPLHPFGAQGYRITLPVLRSGRLVLRQGGEALVTRSLNVVPDRRPRIAFSKPPREMEQWTFSLSYQAMDDYGIESVTAEILVEEGDEVPQAAVLMRDPQADAEPFATDDQVPRRLELSLPVLRSDPKAETGFEDFPDWAQDQAMAGEAPTFDSDEGLRFVGQSFHDLTGHALAGLPVRITLVARDAAGQEGRSHPIPFVLPRRTFKHPIAQRVADQRQTLIRMPSRWRQVTEALDDVTAHPWAYENHLPVHLALRIAMARLAELLQDRTASPTEAPPDAAEGPSPEIRPPEIRPPEIRPPEIRPPEIRQGIASVAELLWDSALVVEEGGLQQSLQDVQTVLEDLREALEKGDSEESVEDLVSNFKSSLAAYLQTLARQARPAKTSDGKTRPRPGSDSGGQTQTSETRNLQSMLEKAQEAAQSGAMNSARRMLSHVEELLMRLKAPPAPGSQEGHQGQMVQKLQTLLQYQQRLIDESFRLETNRARYQGKTPPRVGPTHRDVAISQNRLRRRLGELMRQVDETIGEIPPDLGKAERQMRRATRALIHHQSSRAMQAQIKALQDLQNGTGRVVDALEPTQPGDGFGGEAAVDFGKSDGLQEKPSETEKTDPFGRNAFPSLLGGTGLLQAPSRSDLRRSREIIQELRRRMADTDRPALERAYIQRLLERF